MIRWLMVTLALFVIAPWDTYAQTITKPSNVNELGGYILETFGDYPDEDTQLTGQNFQQIWTGFTPEIREKIVKDVIILSEKGYSVKPDLQLYIEIINTSMLNQNLSEGDLTALLNMTSKVLENYEKEDVSRYLKTLFQIMDEALIFDGPAHQYFLQNSTFAFSYEDQLAFVEEPIEEEPLEEDTTYYDDPWADENYEDDDYYEEDDNWDDENWEDDEWDDENWDDDEWDDEYNEEDDYEDSDSGSIFGVVEEEIYPAEAPVINGPYLRILSGDIILESAKGQFVIENIKGTYSLMDNVFYSEQGKFVWPEEKGLEGLEVTFLGIRLDATSPVITIPASNLNFPSYVDEVVKGEFLYDGSNASRPSQNPKFISYRNDLEPNIFDNNSIYLKGGVSIIGGSIESTSKSKSISELIISEKGQRRIKSKGFRFYMQDSLIYSNNSSVTIFHRLDSIYHPSIRFKYDPKTNEILFVRQKTKYKDTPYTSSYFGVDFTADVIRWDMDTSTMEISILNAKSELPVIFQSHEYYSSEVYQGFSNLYDFNPIAIAVDYARKKRANTFFASDISDHFGLDLKQVKGGMMELVERGYADYDFISGKFTLRNKARVFYLAKHNKRDFDNLLILSQMPNGANVVFNIETEEMEIRGVERFYISEILDVYIEPDSSKISLQNNRNFNFDGKLFAGNFEYDGQDFQFRYDSFLVELNNIEKIQFFVQDEETGERRKVDNAISGLSAGDSIATGGLDKMSGTSGTLYVNKPKNKSGRKVFSEYPKFDGSGTGSIVYFDNRDYLDGAYGKTLYFVLPPFDLDSLSDSDPAAINFNGTFASRGMLPEFGEELHIMDDYSLGFEHAIPPDGYQLFEGDGRLFNRVSMDKRGLVGHGLMNYLTSTLNSEDFIFYPDSVTANGIDFTMEEGDFNGKGYPRMRVSDFTMNWKHAVDSMYITNNADPIDIYDGVVSLDGTATVRHDGVFGKGSLISPNSKAISQEFNFQKDRFLARHSDFVVNSNDPEKPALAGNDVRINFDVTNMIAEINPEVEGTAAVEFPYAQFKTSIPTAVWDLNKGVVTMVKPEDIDIRYSYFYTTRKELDSLRFNAERAEYDINTQELKVSGIPYIIVADSKITPENGEVLILADSKIGTLRNTTLEIDTLNGFHNLYDGTVDIISRNEYLAEATYQFVNSVQDTFAIKLTDFRLDPIDGRSKNGETQTVADGFVPEEQGLIVSEGMFYKGNVRMKARKPALELDGFVKLNLNIADYDTWISYSSDAEQQVVVFNFDEAQTENGEELTAGIHFDYNNYDLYPTFIFDKRNDTDEDFFVPSGFLSYKADSGEYVIIDRDKDLGLSYKGNMFVYDENDGSLEFEGTLNFIQNNKDVRIDAAGNGKGTFENMNVLINAFLMIDYNVPSSIYEFMAADFLETIDLLGALEANSDRTTLLYNLAELIGDRPAKDFETKSNEGYVPLISMSPKLVKPFVFSDIQMKWDQEQNAFYNLDGTAGLSNVLRNDINAQFEVFLEVRKGIEGDAIDLFVKAGPVSWYYFGFAEDKLLVYSSNKELNDFVSQKTNQGKAKIGEFVFAPGDRGEVLDFVNSFRLIYYGIKEPYELDGEVVVEEEKEETADDDDDGF